MLSQQFGQPAGQRPMRPVQSAKVERASGVYAVHEEACRFDLDLYAG